MIILLGSNGYVGREFQKFFNRNQVPALCPSREDIDIGNVAALADYLRTHDAEFLINAAGFTGKPNVDACEFQKAETLFGNAVLPGRIGEACRLADVPWGHISSGCIFQGSRPDGTGFCEDDTPNFTFRANNCSFYSGSKSLGEEVLQSFSECYIWRLRIPFNHQESPRNYLTKLMRYQCLLDARNSISELSEFVQACWEMWSRKIPFGTYHVTNPGSITTREVVELIQESGVCNKEFQFFANEAEFMKIAAQTPRSNCVLNTNKLASYGIALTEVRQAVQSALNRWEPNTDQACGSNQFDSSTSQ